MSAKQATKVWKPLDRLNSLWPNSIMNRAELVSQCSRALFPWVSRLLHTALFIQLKSISLEPCMHCLTSSWHFRPWQVSEWCTLNAHSCPINSNRVLYYYSFHSVPCEWSVMLTGTSLWCRQCVGLPVGNGCVWCVCTLTRSLTGPLSRPNTLILIISALLFGGIWPRQYGYEFTFWRWRRSQAIGCLFIKKKRCMDMLWDTWAYCFPWQWPVVVVVHTTRGCTNSWP